MNVLIPDTYDDAIQAAVDLRLPGYDWRLLKAQFYQESRLKPLAESPAGAVGIAQFMPATWQDVCRQLGWSLDTPRAEPEKSIEAGAYYMRQMRDAWLSSAASQDDQRDLALASYNAGIGNVGRASRLAFPLHATITWAGTAARLPEITGARSRETIDYVHLILGYWVQLGGRLDTDGAAVSA